MNKKVKIIMPIFIFLAILYIIIAFRPLSSEIQFLPVWTIDLESYTKGEAETPKAEDFNNAVSFKLGQTLGYFTPEGKILNYLTFPYKATVSHDSYSLYGTASTEMQITSPSGNQIGKISVTGFPYFTEDRKFIFLPGGSSFSKLNEDGSVEWTYEGFSPITAFSSSSTGIVAGFANGKVLGFDNKGNITHNYEPGGSNHEVILGAAISESSEYIATLSGQGGQRFVISKRTDASHGAHTLIAFYKSMDTELTRQVLIKFSKDEKKVFYNSAKGIGIVDCRNYKNTEIPIKGRILSILESGSENEIFILSKEGRTYTVSTIESFDAFQGAFSFEADSACIAVRDNSLFIGRDGKLSRIDIIHR
ncbi:MAG: hypothetical protein IJ530_14315 [Treponema sp.]|uniref:hypothetical protein n=1 Tax=Treponema sp. TaxID=166 RepID=UPI0025F9318E|nr:hypothetical protein [Treponema sp.]MBQ8680906.1 hypothetical protein [Treponema sp.]